jgi:hypothetical protein
MNEHLPKLAKFDRVPLVYAIRRKPTGFINASELIPLVGDPLLAEVCVVASLTRLLTFGLIKTSAGPKRLRFKRTAGGVVLGERLLSDGRLSFQAAIKCPASETLAGFLNKDQ